MDELSSRLQQDAQLEAELHAVAASSIRADIRTPPRAGTLIESTEMSPQTRAVIAASAARRQRPVSAAVSSTVGFDMEGDYDAAPRARAPLLHSGDTGLSSHTPAATTRADKGRGSLGASGIPRPKPAAAPADARRPAAAAEDVPTEAQMELTSAAFHVDADLPLESQVRLLRSHLGTAIRELRAVHNAASRLRGEVAELQRQAGSAGEERARLARAVAAADQAVAKAKKAAELAESRETELRTEIVSLQKEAAAASKAARAAGTSSSSMDVRLARAQEEIDRLRTENHALRGAVTAGERSAKEAAASHDSALKRVEKQKVELLSAFKKQLKLIDVLKRQRIHMEAARLLAFTEEEFSRILDSTGP